MRYTITIRFVNKRTERTVTKDVFSAVLDAENEDARKELALMLADDHFSPKLNERMEVHKIEPEFE